MESKYRYGDDYPKQCPPSTANCPIGGVLFRVCKNELVKNGKLNSDNFIPAWETPRRNFPPVQECSAKALSFFDTVKGVKDLLRKHPKIGNTVIKIELNRYCGVIEKTGDKGHYSLWDLKEPCIVDAIEGNWKEVYLDEQVVSQ
ncbi:hypothetical protein [Listeria grandensis]|uniref:Uncharacterized protein n=1 Tax=Listeria grandensis TaxID=1494963 RepID=A0A7X1CNK2_9LIST|nr:hypothetical protein [Listeria grandensis]MBC1935080.1 hypothetical protein [Listeria grandensis]MBC6314652.1 hypothetical protein [Listeria grandensis]